MDNKIIIKCGEDEISADRIIHSKIITFDEDILKELEIKQNGPFPQKTLQKTNICIKYELQKNVEALLNEYWREIAYYLPKPHEDFLADSKSTFKLVEYSEYERLYILDESKKK